jgi:ribosomal protein S18 acetylase RimI-like enzyme
VSAAPALALETATVRDAPAIAAFLAERFAATFGHTYRPEDLEPFLRETYQVARIARELADPACGHWIARAGTGGAFTGRGSDVSANSYFGSAALSAEAGGELWAVAQMGPMGLPFPPRHGERAVELKRLYLAEAVKGVGLADRLMDVAFDWARGQGAQAVYLGVWAENVRAQRFYARHGFERVGDYHFVVGEARDEEWILRAAVPPDSV